MKLSVHTHVRLEAFLAYSRGPAALTIAPETLEKLTITRKIVEAHAAGDKPVYGISTARASPLATTRLSRFMRKQGIGRDELH